MDWLSQEDLLGNGADPRRLDSFIEPPTIEWFDLFPHYGRDRASLEAEMLAGKKWRYHHNIPAMMENGDLYKAYVTRVDALLAMSDDALAGITLRKDLSKMSVVDLGCAEGFVAAHFIRRGIASIDCFELAMGNIKRFRLVAAWHNLGRAEVSQSTVGPQHVSGRETPIRLGRLDLENVAWARAVDRSYDLVLALGIVYHMENLALFCRNLYEITTDVCLVESDTPYFPGAPRFRGNGVVYLHRDQVTLESGHVRRLTEMRPDVHALTQLLLSVGFTRVAVVPPNEKIRYSQYDSGEKSLLVCTK
jgi:SAM-dependent methyltransferase